jgi:hypothetical protein
MPEMEQRLSAIRAEDRRAATHVYHSILIRDRS